MQKIVIKIFRHLKPFKYSRWFFNKYFYSISFERTWEVGYTEPVSSILIICGKKYRRWSWIDKK